MTNVRAFKSDIMNRPDLEDFSFNTLSVMKRGELTRLFSEVVNAVWDCDSFKSSGRGGIIFDFIKDFWEKLKLIIMRVILEFHRNGKLVKGLNCTFIALILKVDEYPQGL